MTKKSVAKKNNSEIANSEVPEFLKNSMTSSRGSENVGSDDLTIPRLELVQSLSKCRKKSDPNYIEGIQEGQFYNNITREIYGDAVTLCPVAFKKEYLLWRDQDLGGGFGGAFESESDAKEALSQQENPSEWEVVDTHQQFCVLVKEDGTLEDIVVSMSKSKAKISRKWNSLVRINGGDRFTRLYTLAGVEDQNDKGQDFFNVTIKNKGFVTEEIFTYAEKVYELIQSGVVSADRSVDISDEDYADETEM